MAKFQKTVDIWTLTIAERAKLQVGQWVSAGSDSSPENRGVWCGQTKGSDVVAWQGNAKAYFKGPQAYRAALRGYAQQHAA